MEILGLIGRNLALGGGCGGPPDLSRVSVDLRELSCSSWTWATSMRCSSGDNDDATIGGTLSHTVSVADLGSRSG